MLTRHIIRAVSINQSNDQSCHNNDCNCRNARRNADKRRRQFLARDLRRELEDWIADPVTTECMGPCIECRAYRECTGSEFWEKWNCSSGDFDELDWPDNDYLDDTRFSDYHFLHSGDEHVLGQ